MRGPRLVVVEHVSQRNTEFEQAAEQHGGLIRVAKGDQPQESACGANKAQPENMKRRATLTLTVSSREWLLREGASNVDHTRDEPLGEHLLWLRGHPQHGELLTPL